MRRFTVPPRPLGLQYRAGTHRLVVVDQGNTVYRFSWITAPLTEFPRPKTMTEHEAWQVSGNAAEVYERCFVPAISGRWAPQVVDAARVAAGDRVLDVGCGTGVLARAAADGVEADRKVSGLDLNEGMLAVARRLRPNIDWRHGDATDLPFADASYDVVVSQFALMYFPDRAAALREMVRVLRTGGRLAVAVWGPSSAPRAT
jgi:ubiquinone/menaquinone biosynthesis C-methylase UbiE